MARKAVCARAGDVQLLSLRSPVYELTPKRQSLFVSFLQLLFRSVNKLLMDTATSEYLFCSDFFQEAAVFHELFAPTLQVVESALAATLPVSAHVPSCPELLVSILQVVESALAATLLVSTHAPSCPELFVSMLQAVKICLSSNPSSQCSCPILS